MEIGTIVTKAGWYACSQEGSHENQRITYAFCDTDEEEARHYARVSGLGSIRWFNIGDIL